MKTTRNEPLDYTLLFTVFRFQCSFRESGIAIKYIVSTTLCKMLEMEKLKTNIKIITLRENQRHKESLL